MTRRIRLAVILILLVAVGTLTTIDHPVRVAGTESAGDTPPGPDVSTANPGGDGADEPVALGWGAEGRLTPTDADADTDGDGLADAREEALGSDPLDQDTDGDGLTDLEELRAGTSPSRRDTDGDGRDDPTELARGSPAGGPDTDADGLGDAREVELGTDPENADTDADGLVDGVELAEDRLLTGADPMHADVFVEIDFMADERPQQAALDRVVAAFADAPIENPDGEDGITLHLVVDDELPAENATDIEGFLALREAHFDNRTRGYHYGLFVADVAPESGDDFDPAGRGFRGGFWLERQASANVTGVLFMHELGHTLGLLPAVYEGIDGELPFKTYPSVMNYRSPWDFHDYSGGTGFDDWAYVAEKLAERVDTRGLAPEDD
jgi:hypothetical protein